MWVHMRMIGCPPLLLWACVACGSSVEKELWAHLYMGGDGMEMPNLEQSVLKASMSCMKFRLLQRNARKKSDYLPNRGRGILRQWDTEHFCCPSFIRSLIHFFLVCALLFFGGSGSLVPRDRQRKWFPKNQAVSGEGYSSAVPFAADRWRCSIRRRQVALCRPSASQRLRYTQQNPPFYWKTPSFCRNKIKNSLIPTSTPLVGFFLRFCANIFFVYFHTTCQSKTGFFFFFFFFKDLIPFFSPRKFLRAIHRIHRHSFASTSAVDLGRARESAASLKKRLI